MLNVLKPFFPQGCPYSFILTLICFASDSNSVTIVGTNSGMVYLAESLEGYVAYSKAATVTVSKAEQCMRWSSLSKSSEAH